MGWFLIALGIVQVALAGILFRRYLGRPWNRFTLLAMAIAGVSFIAVGVVSLTTGVVRTAAMVITLVGVTGMLTATAWGFRTDRRSLHSG